MDNTSFYEVLDSKNRFMGIYSTDFDSKINIGINSMGMALINAKHCGGQIFSVSREGERKLVWPKV